MSGNTIKTYFNADMMEPKFTTLVLESKFDLHFFRKPSASKRALKPRAALRNLLRNCLQNRSSQVTWSKS